MRDRINVKSAKTSKIIFLFSFIVFKEKKENMQANASRSVTTVANSSIKVTSDLLAMCKEVITNKQNPKRFAEVLKMCWEVLLDIEVSFFKNTNFNLLFHTGQRST